MATRIAMNTTSADGPSPQYAAPSGDKPQNVQTARGRYEELRGERDPYVRRAELCASLSIPSLFPKEGENGTTDFKTPWQAVAAEGLLTWSAKFLLALFPPGQPCFKRQPTLKVIEQLRKKYTEGSPEFLDAKTALESALAVQEREVTDSLEAAGFRPSAYEGLKQAGVAGNFLVQQLDSGRLNVFRLNQYVVCRDCDGNVIEIVLHQRVDKAALPREARLLYEASPHVQDADKQKREVDLFTWVKRHETRESVFRVCQQVGDVTIPSSEGLWPISKSPVFVVAINRVPGETYGRSHMELHLGDILSHDGLSQSVVQGIAAMVRIVTLVDEGGQTDKAELESAETGDYIDGREADVHTLQSEKSVDLQVAAAFVDKIERRLAKAFLNTSSIQRDAERVTAEEIRMLAQELENNFGGLFSLLSQEFQYPLVNRRIFVMERSGELPRLPEKSIKLTIIAGLAALGRSSDFQRLMTLMTSAKGAVGDAAVAEYTNVGDFLSRGATAIGVESKGLFKSEADVQAARQQKAQQELSQKTMPNAVKAGADLLMQKNDQAEAQSA